MRATTIVLLCGIALLDLGSAHTGPEHCAVADFNASLDRLSRVLQHDTVAGNTAAFQRLHSFIAASYPAAWATVSAERVSQDGLSLLLTWAGLEPQLRPVLFVAHLDVVLAHDEARWTHPPFSGAVDGGFVWGRGAIDVKCTVVALLEAVEELAAAGFTPRRTIIIAFGHDEESRAGQGAGAILAGCLAGCGAAVALGAACALLWVAPCPVCWGGAARSCAVTVAKHAPPLAHAAAAPLTPAQATWLSCCGSGGRGWR
jgi:carboxypeptidase PM20D1